ncbi:MAG: hypothetical protein MR416_11835 [Lachnospiraceae bacterium]|nr:hypothetical protein [Lachnospiraceae bacterium]
MSFTFVNIILIVVFLFMGVQVRGGNTDVLGKNIMEQIKPECKMDYCREISIPIFMFAVIEVIDLIMQTTLKLENWSLIILGAGMLLCLGWFYLIHSKYRR